MAAMNKFEQLMSRVPADVFNTIILPYSYKPQTSGLRNDLHHYVESKKKITSLYHAIWDEIGNEGDDIKWLAGDLIRYNNSNREPGIYCDYNYFYSILRRHSCCKNYTNPEIMVYINDVFSHYSSQKQFNIMWGLLYPCERQKFISIQQKYVDILNLSL